MIMMDLVVAAIFVVAVSGIGLFLKWCGRQIN